jgi:hypothetical protein
LSSDPKELRDLYEPDPARWAELEGLLAQWSAEVGDSAFESGGAIAYEPDPELLDNLRALGYLE